MRCQSSRLNESLQFFLEVGGFFISKKRDGIGA